MQTSRSLPQFVFNLEYTHRLHSKQSKQIYAYSINSLETMFTLYTWFIRTSLEYAAPVWHPGLSSQQHTRIERIQKLCFWIILGKNYINYQTAQITPNTTTLFNRREELLLKVGRKVLKSEKLTHILPPYLHIFYGCNTRRGRQFLQPVRCRTTRYQKSSIIYAVKLLNTQPM